MDTWDLAGVFQVLRLIAYIVPIAVSGALLGSAFVTPVLLLPVASWPAPHNCSQLIGNVSFQGLGFVASVGPPLYAWPQFVIKPGAVAALIVTYESSNNLRILFGPRYRYGGLPSYFYWGTVGHNAILAWNQTGVQISLSSIVYQDNFTAHLTYEVRSNSSSPLGTHVLAWDYTCYGVDRSPLILLTVGSQTYNGPLPLDQGYEKISFTTAVARALTLPDGSVQFLIAAILALDAIPALCIFDCLYKGPRVLRK